MNNPRSSRIVATPYARRIASEHAVVLALIAGSGPSGRIVAADVLAFRPPAQSDQSRAAAPVSSDQAPPPANVGSPAAASSFGGIATTIRLDALHVLMAQLGDLGREPAFEDFCLRALAGVMIDIPAASRALSGDAAIRPDEIAIAIEIGEGRELGLRNLWNRTLSVVTRAREQALQWIETGVPGETEAFAFSLRVLQHAGLRPVAMPLKSGRKGRLVIFADPGSATAECLLIFDGRAISEETAAAMVSAFKGYLETPLRLLA